MVRFCPWPHEYPRLAELKLSVGGSSVEVLQPGGVPFAVWESDGACTVTLEYPPNLGFSESDRVCPQSWNIPCQSLPGTLEATIPGPGTYWVGKPGEVRLMLFVHPVADEPAWASQPGTLRFEPGTITQVGNLELRPGQNLFIPAGAVVQGCLRAHGVSGLKLGGRGILDMQTYQHEGQWHMVQMDGCREVLIEDLLLVRPRSWMVVLGGCEHVEVRGLREVGEVIGSDGVDVVGSRHVTVHGCGFTNNDDCVVVKSLDARTKHPRVQHNWAQDVQDVHVRDCVFLNQEGGNGVEIGHELRTDRVGDILFENLIIGSVRGVGAPLSIHAGDRAAVEDVEFRDIHIEHHYEKFLDFRVMRSQFNRDLERGQIRRVKLTRVKADARDFNWGYTVSTIGGWDQEHRVEDLLFEDVDYGPIRLSHLDDIEVFTRHLGRVEFRNTSEGKRQTGESR